MKFNKNKQWALDLFITMYDKQKIFSTYLYNEE